MSGARVVAAFAALAVASGCGLRPSTGAFSFKVAPTSAGEVVDLAYGTKAKVLGCERPHALHLWSDDFAITVALDQPDGAHLVQASEGEGVDKRYFTVAGTGPQHGYSSSQVPTEATEGSFVISSAMRDRMHWLLDIDVRADVDEYKWNRSDHRFEGPIGRHDFVFRLDGRVPAVRGWDVLSYTYCDPLSQETARRAGGDAASQQDLAEGNTP